MSKARQLHAYYSSIPSEGSYAARCHMLIPEGLEGKKILDIGCRSGKGAAKLADAAGPQGFVLGVDWNKDHVDQAFQYAFQSKAKLQECAPLAFVHGYPESMDEAGIDEEEFDIAYVNSCMSLFFDLKESLGQLSRALAPEGRLIIDGVFADRHCDPFEIQRAKSQGDVIYASPFIEDFLLLLQKIMPCTIECEKKTRVSPCPSNGKHSFCHERQDEGAVGFFSYEIQATKHSKPKSEDINVSSNKSPIYLDNAATTKPYESVVSIMTEAMIDNWGNPSSTHFVGNQAKDSLERCRAFIAETIGASPEEIYFTSGATESNNLAIEGVGGIRTREQGAGHAITSELEHAAVTKPIRALRRQGWDVSYISAKHGLFDLEGFEAVLRSAKRTDLVSIMAVQNEFGFIFPTKRISQIARKLAPEAIIHVDAVQAYGKMPIDVNEWDIDMMTFCSHKIGGPKGIGALYVRNGVRLFSNALGGGQEGGLRSGTQALPQILGFSEAARISCEGQEEAYKLATTLRNKVVDAVLEARPDAIINSREDGSPFILSMSIPDTENAKIIASLSEKGICISGSSACSSNKDTVEPGTWRPKHPLSIQLAGIPHKLTESTYRISFRDTTTIEETNEFINAFVSLVS